MPITGALITGGAGLLGGLVKGIVGGGQKRKAHKILDNLQYPNEQIPTEITNAAATGLPSEQYNQAMQNIQRQQLMALRGAHDRRGGLASIAGIQQGTNDANLNLDVKNAEARQANQFRLASWKDKVWQNNVKAKYNQQYNYGMGLLGAGNQNLIGGIDQGIGGLEQAGWQLSQSENGGGGNYSTGNGNGSTYMKRY